MIFKFSSKKTETEKQRIIRFADTIVVNSNYEGELDKDCLDVFGILTKDKLIPPLAEIRDELRKIQPNNVDATGSVNLDLTNEFVQNNYDLVKTHLLNYGYISKPDHTQKWTLNDVGKKMKQLKGHNNYQGYIDKKLKAEIAEMNGKIYWKRRVIISAILAGLVGFGLRYLTEPKQQVPTEQSVLKKSNQSTPAKSSDNNDSTKHN